MTTTTDVSTEAKTAPTRPVTRKGLRRARRMKLSTKIRTDQAFAKAHFEAKSKRSAEKKSAFRKKKTKKKA